jgi:uncharacterized coiled-coil protein SlyX
MATESERIAVLETKVENQEQQLGRFDKAVEALTATLRETNTNLVKLQLGNSYQRGQHAARSALIVGGSSMVGGILTIIGDFLFRH